MLFSLFMLERERKGKEERKKKPTHLHTQPPTHPHTEKKNGKIPQKSKQKNFFLFVGKFSHINPPPPSLKTGTQETTLFKTYLYS